MISELQRAREIRRRAAAKYRLTHPATVRVKQQRYEYMRKRLLEWARSNYPQVVRGFEHEAMRLYPACLADEDHPERTESVEP